MSGILEETNPSDPSPRPSVDIQQFVIQAQPEASVLIRVLELFALRGLLPSEVACHNSGDGREGGLHIHIVITGLSRQQADSLAARMRNIIPVSRVVLNPA